jgi:hypothetical protein
LRGTGTATVEAKLAMQLAKQSGKPYFMVFLDLKKAYDTLDCKRTLDILKGYGVGNNMSQIISQVWEGYTMIPEQAGYFGKAFKASRGVKQGDITSPMIFNIVEDAVIREYEFLMGPRAETTFAQFYANDGMLHGHIHEDVQFGVDVLTEVFARMGLKMNAAKTKQMSI